jgi:hypothetical protein
MTTQPDWLKTAVRKSREHTWTLGHIFATAHRIEGKSPEDLAAELDCSLETLDWLALCRRPEEERFAEDLEAIAERFKLEPLPLAKLIRRVESLDTFTSRREQGSVRDAMQMAARDHHSDDDEGEP